MLLLSFTIATMGCVGPLGVSNLLARFNFSPKFGKYEVLHLGYIHSPISLFCMASFDIVQVAVIGPCHLLHVSLR